MLLSEIKSHPLYGRYIIHHYGYNRSLGEIALYKISESNFLEFKNKYESDPIFSKLVDDTYVRNREVKIEDIISDKSGE